MKSWKKQSVVIKLKSLGSILLDKLQNTNKSEAFPTFHFKLNILGLSTIVTEAGPRNGSVDQGSDANLFCRVKSLISPHVQWLKKLEPSNDQTSDDQVKMIF